VPLGPDRHLSAPYTFGDSPVEARRLGIVQETFGPSSRALLASAVDGPPALAYDLGCGPGLTTRLVADVTGAAHVVGLDRSPALLARAIGEAGERVSFREWDVTRLPLPAGPADLIYGRLLLAHVRGPANVACSWATQLAPGGMLVIDEIEGIETTNPALRSHLDLAARQVATTGAVMCAGPLLAGLGTRLGLRPRLRQVTEVAVTTARAADMFAASLEGWGTQAVAAGLCSKEDLTELAGALIDLRRSTTSGEITWKLHQAVYGPNTQ
jgi:trans-aconitate 2-methyltransferase